MGLYTLFLATVAVVGVFLEPTGRLYMWIAGNLWGRTVLSIGGIRLVVKGRENIQKKQTYVVCANHASQMDIPAVFGGLNIPVRFMAKKSLFFIPIFGWSMWLAGFIPVSRTSTRKARESIQKAARKVKKGPSVLVFPEGTRSANGQIQSFKSGAFVLALQAGVPILPVAIRGSYQVFPRNTVKVSPGTIEFVIGTPIQVTDVDMNGKEIIRQRTKDAISKMFETGDSV
ncbi:MAG: 1-acyl-sn-glycerol-3-phosphate acyltransferase [Deltaproteobacteria bacterium]|nr:1-acyl-sn-glycerol-3-phosphate acyltransferase [Deltaproteobacteria bacterium]MBN2671525.1 1-acyl-sn-glycerol-3-phosphate acyltransferase [Deltaproteobacteria bacterium]